MMDNYYKEVASFIHDKIDPSWSGIEKIRFIYLQLGLLLEKNTSFFLNDKLTEFALSDEEMKSIYNDDVNKVTRKYNVNGMDVNVTQFQVICKSAALFLKEAFLKEGFYSNLISTVNVVDDIQHWFIVVRDEFDNQYFLTLAADLPFIKNNMKTEHFGNDIKYIDDNGIPIYNIPNIDIINDSLDTSKVIFDNGRYYIDTDDGRLYLRKRNFKIFSEDGNIKNKEFLEIDHKTINDKELYEIDKKIGFAFNKDNNNIYGNLYEWDSFYHKNYFTNLYKELQIQKSYIYKIFSDSFNMSEDYYKSIEDINRDEINTFKYKLMDFFKDDFDDLLNVDVYQKGINVDNCKDFLYTYMIKIINIYLPTINTKDLDFNNCYKLINDIKQSLIKKCNSLLFIEKIIIDEDDNTNQVKQKLSNIKHNIYLYKKKIKFFDRINSYRSNDYEKIYNYIFNEYDKIEDKKDIIFIEKFRNSNKDYKNVVTSILNMSLEKRDVCVNKLINFNHQKKYLKRIGGRVKNALNIYKDFTNCKDTINMIEVMERIKTLEDIFDTFIYLHEKNSNSLDDIDRLKYKKAKMQLSAPKLRKLLDTIAMYEINRNDSFEVNKYVSIDYVINKFCFMFPRIFECSFKNNNSNLTFDASNFNSFNIQNYSEQIVIIKKITNAMFEELTYANSHQMEGYDNNYSAVENRIQYYPLLDRSSKEYCIGIRFGKSRNENDAFFIYIPSKNILRERDPMMDRNKYFIVSRRFNAELNSIEDIDSNVKTK